MIWLWETRALRAGTGRQLSSLFWETLRTPSEPRKDWWILANVALAASSAWRPRQEWKRTPQARRQTLQSNHLNVKAWLNI